MPLPATPPTNTTSPFASMHGHHTAIRYPDFEAARTATTHLDSQGDTDASSMQTASEFVYAYAKYALASDRPRPARLTLRVSQSPERKTLVADAADR